PLLGPGQAPPGTGCGHTGCGTAGTGVDTGPTGNGTGAGPTTLLETVIKPDAAGISLCAWPRLPAVSCICMRMVTAAELFGRNDVWPVTSGVSRTGFHTPGDCSLVR